MTSCAGAARCAPTRKSNAKNRQIGGWDLYTTRDLRFQEVAVADVGFLALMVAFVALATSFALGCDKIIGPDEEAMSESLRDLESLGDTEPVGKPRR